MADIKISDVFELPLKSIEYQNQIVDKNKMELLFADFHEYEKDALITAINAYDQNQERIKELECAIRNMNNRGRIDMDAVRECYSMVVSNEKT